MFTEAHIILSFIYNRSGKTQLTPSDIYLPLSLELKWFTTTQARQFVIYCQHQQLLKETTNGLTPTFDINTITIPIGFKPTQQKYTLPNTTPTTKKTPTALNTLKETLAASTNKSETQLMQKLQNLTQTKNINQLAAAQLYAYAHNIPIPIQITDIEEIIIKENVE